MKTRIYRILCSYLCYCSLCIACSNGDTPDAPQKDNNPTQEEQPGNSNDVNKIEYDDGEQLIFNVKIAIDKEGLDFKNGDLEWFKENLKKQWGAINERFNALDKKNLLERTYRFIPDLEDIWVYSREECPSDINLNDFHWNIPKIYDKKGKLDKTKFQCCVVYDFMAQSGEGSGGCGDYEGISNILVIHTGDNKFTNHFDNASYGTESITHELGHFRGLIDTYTHSVSAQDNPISHTAFTPETGNMNNCYPSIEKEAAVWNQYEAKVLNVNKSRKLLNLISVTMRDYFADGIEIAATMNGTPVTESITVNFYDASGHKVKTDAIKEKSKVSDNGTITIDAYDLFWKDNKDLYPWAYYDIFLVEVITESGHKGYAFLPNYHVHEQGLSDKSNPDFQGRSIFKLSINIE